MTKLRNVHIVIAGPKITNNKIKFRRRRLAEYLVALPETKEVIWIYFNPSKLTSFGKVELTFPNEKIKIFQVEISDYKFILANSKKLQTIFLKKVFSVLIGYSDYSRYLWYTVPRFAKLAEYKYEKIIYDCSDYWQGQYSNASILRKIKGYKLIDTEQFIISKSNLCFASSDYLFTYLKKSTQNVKLIENGVDFSHFNENKISASNLANIKGPKLGFVGDMIPLKIDFDLLLSLARDEPTWNIILIGPARHPQLKYTSFSDLLKLSNVHYLGFIDFIRIPQFLNCLDVALLPYKENDFNKGVFPIKFYEYLAAGKPVVGIGLPSTLNCGEDGVYYYSSNYAEFLKNCHISLRTKQNKRRLYLAKQAEWDKKFFEMMEFVSIEITDTLE